MCSMTTAAGCLPIGGAGSYLGNGTACSAGVCPDIHPCCRLDGSCIATVAANCPSSVGAFLSCELICGAPNPPVCPVPTACCHRTTGACVVVTPAACAALGQTNGCLAGSTCTVQFCPVPVLGACCSGSTCAVVNQPTCTGPNRRFAGAATACNPAGTTRQPCCKGDFNQSGSPPTVQDIFDFLAAYFGGNSQADINGGGLSVQDIFDLLAAYFAGCG
jgi:hypothetical protein